MPDPKDRRTVYRIARGPEGYTEQQAEMKDLQPGELFRMDEPTGEPVEGPHGERVFRANSKPYLENDVWTVVTDIIREHKDDEI